MPRKETTKSVELSKGKLLGFRHLESSDSTNELASRADELFTKRSETPTSPKKS